MKKKIYVIKEKCISCGACVAASPNQAIKFDEDGKALVDPSIATEEDEIVIELCPTEAIELKDYDNNKNK